MDIMLQAGIEIVSIRLFLQQREQALKGLFDRADHSQIHSGATANLLSAHVDLDDLRVFRIELLVWKVAAEYQQRLTVHHGLITGGEPEKSGHSHVVGIVILDEFLFTPSKKEICAMGRPAWTFHSHTPIRTDREVIGK